MSAAQIRRRLHELIDIAEVNKLKAIYTLLEDKSDDHQLSIEQKIALDRRLDDHAKGIGKTYSWDETVIMAERALADRKANNAV